MNCKGAVCVLKQPKADHQPPGLLQSQGNSGFCTWPPGSSSGQRINCWRLDLLALHQRSHSLNMHIILPSRLGSRSRPPHTLQTQDKGSQAFWFIPDSPLQKGPPLLQIQAAFSIELLVAYWRNEVLEWRLSGFSTWNPTGSTPGTLWIWSSPSLLRWATWHTLYLRAGKSQATKFL